MSTLLDSVQVVVVILKKIFCLFFRGKHKRFNENLMHISWLMTLFAGTIHSLAIETLNQSPGIATTIQPLFTTNSASSTLVQSSLNATTKKFIVKPTLSTKGNPGDHYDDHQNPTSGPSFNYYLDKNAHKSQHDGSSELEPPPKRFQVAKFDFDHG